MAATSLAFKRHFTPSGTFLRMFVESYFWRVMAFVFFLGRCFGPPFQHLEQHASICTHCCWVKQRSLKKKELSKKKKQFFALEF